MNYKYPAIDHPKWLIISFICIMVLIPIYWYGFTQNPHYFLTGEEAFDNSDDTLAFVAHLENIESQNASTFLSKHIELTGKGTTVSYELEFSRPPRGAMEPVHSEPPLGQTILFAMLGAPFMLGAYLLFMASDIRLYYNPNDKWDWRGRLPSKP